MTLRDRARKLVLSFRRKATEAIAPSGARIFFAGRTQAGIRVDHDNALTYSAVWACIRIITETVASLPWGVFARREDGGRDFVDSPVSPLLNRQANADTTAFDFKQSILAWVLSWGNGYAEIERLNGQPVALWQLPPDRVEPERNEQGLLVYRVKNFSGDDSIIPAADVLHFRGLGWDGLRGYSVIAMAAQAIGLGLAAQEFGSTFFGNGAKPGGIITLDGTADDKTIERLRKSWWASHGGPGKSNKPAILEAGTTWQAESVPPEDAQFLQTRNFQVREIARIYRVPPHMLADLERATFSNIEHQAIEFVTTTIVPWVCRMENEIDVKLLGGSAVRGKSLTAKANLNGLLRGDVKSRYEAYNTARNGGWMNANEIRALENLNPQEGDQGKVYWAPRNMVPADQFGEEPEPAPAPALPSDGDDDQGNGRAGAQRVLTAALRRVAARETGMIGDYRKKHTKSESDGWIKDFFARGISKVSFELDGAAVGIVETCVGPDDEQQTRATAIRSIVRDWVAIRAENGVSAWTDGFSNGYWLEERPPEDANDLCRLLAVTMRV